MKGNMVFQSGKPDGMLDVWLTDERTGKKHEVFLSYEDASSLGRRMVTASQEAKLRKERGSVR